MKVKVCDFVYCIFRIQIWQFKKIGEKCKLYIKAKFFPTNMIFINQFFTLNVYSLWFPSKKSKDFNSFSKS